MKATRLTQEGLRFAHRQSTCLLHWGYVTYITTECIACNSVSWFLRSCPLCWRSLQGWHRWERLPVSLSCLPQDVIFISFSQTFGEPPGQRSTAPWTTNSSRTVCNFVVRWCVFLGQLHGKYLLIGYIYCSGGLLTKEYNQKYPLNISKRWWQNETQQNKLFNRL